MQEWIKLVQDWVKLSFKGMIVMWAGLIENIPEGWHLCDGYEGTPDLSNRFIRSAVPAYPPGTKGGANTHNHSFTTDGHKHDLDEGFPIQDGFGWDTYTNTKTDTGITNIGDNVPLYYSLAFIMKL